MNFYPAQISASRLININFKQNENTEEKELLNLYRKGDLKLMNVNKETGDTLFNYIVRSDYIDLVKFITLKPKNRTDLINYAPNGVTPLDCANSKDMVDLLKSRGGKTSNELDGNRPNSYQTATDARVASAKIYMENPIRVTPAEVKPVQKVENKQDDFFDAFDEIEDNSETQTENTEETKTDETTTKSAQEDKTKSKYPDSYKNYTIFEIKADDPKSLDEIIGIDEIKNELKENITIPLKEHVANVTLQANNIDIPNGVLFVTKQNTNKIVKAFANEIEMPVLQLFRPEELKPMLNDIEKNYKKTGHKTIIFIRGLDTFFPKNEEQDKTLLDENNFLLQLEQCRNKGAFIIATAEKRSEVNKKFFNTGILDKVLNYKIPDLESRKEFLRQYSADKQLFSSLTTPEILQEIAEKTQGFTYEDMEKVLEESARTSISHKEYVINPETIRNELFEYSKDAGIVPIDDFNKTAMYDTPEFKRVPVAQGEIMKLDDLGGMPEIKELLTNLYIEPFKNLDSLRKEIGNAAIPDGAIFYGPAGNGKTLTAKVLARELKLPFYETKLSDVASSYIHQVSKSIRQMAKQLNDKYEATGEMSVWFFDEFDSLGENRDGAAGHKQEVTDTLLQEFNNPASKGFILIAATNDLDGVDPALKRRGRLGNWIQFSQPEFDARKDVIQKNLRQTSFTKHLADDKVFLDAMAKEFDGNSMADITSVLSDAKRMSLLKKKDFKECIKDCRDIHIKRKMGEFCNKAGLKQHEYSENAFQTLDEMGGMEDVKLSLEENIIDIWRPEVRKALIANKRALPGGVILEGPPGTGKTTIIETLAKQMDVPLYKMNYSQEGNEYIHGVSRNVTDIFERLALMSKIIKKPVMLFFDEAEKFFPRHAGGHQIEEVNTYKDLMNTAAASGIILVAATNHIDMVNAEIIGNPRRMGTVIHVGNPDIKSRTNIFEKLLADLPITNNSFSKTDFVKLAEITGGYSIGDITNIIDKAVTQAIKKCTTITPEILIKTIRTK